MGLNSTFFLLIQSQTFVTGFLSLKLSLFQLSFVAKYHLWRKEGAISNLCLHFLSQEIATGNQCSWILMLCNAVVYKVNFYKHFKDQIDQAVGIREVQVFLDPFCLIFMQVQPVHLKLRVKNRKSQQILHYILFQKGSKT